MAVRLHNCLTNEVWNLPDSVAATTFHLGLYPPGEYNIATSTAMTVAYGSNYRVALPAASIRNLNNNENIRSFLGISPESLIARIKGN